MLQRIKKLQKRAARIILDAPLFTSTQQLFDSLNWLPFRDRIPGSPPKFIKCLFWYTCQVAFGGL